MSKFIQYSKHEDSSRMTATDVAGLASEKLPEAAFPAPRAAEFRVSVAAKVHDGVWKHAEENTSVEICGVLVGRWATDADGPYASVTEYIRCDGATQKFAEVTFTHESWAQINKEMDTKYQDLRIIGWYHTHPNFGIFLSDRDNFIQQHFFSGAGQIALVVDPIRKLEGIFIWRRGKTTPLTHYWVGDRILTGAQVTADGVERAPDAAAPATATAAPAPAFGGESSLHWLMLLLMGICLFQLGYMLSGMLSAREEMKNHEWAVAHYGVWKLYKPNFEDTVLEMAKQQDENRQEIKRLAALLPAPDDATIAEAQKKAWAEVDRRLLEMRDLTIKLGQVYGLNEKEKELTLKLIAEKYATAPLAKPEMPSTVATTPTSSPTATPTASPTPSIAPQPGVAGTIPTAGATPTPTAPR